MTRIVTAVVVLASMLLVAAPAGAAPRHATTRVAAHVAPATVHVGASLVVSGSVSPRVAGVPVLVQRLVGKGWQVVGTGKVNTGGAFSIALKAPAVAAKWVVRVTRAASATAKAGVSASFQVRVVKALYVVQATGAGPVPADQPVVVTGSVRPKAAGSVALQQLVGRTWHQLATVRLTAASTFAFSAQRPPGAYRLRVLKVFSTTVAGGVSPGLSVTVLPPVTVVVAAGPPSVSTASLPAATVGLTYAAALSATGGVAPYTWTSAGLPAGLTFSPAGVVSGTPTAPGVSTVTVVVIDSAGRSGSVALTMTTVAPAHPAGRLWAWGYNAVGELGNNSTTNSDVLVPVSGQTSVVQVSAGQFTGYALRSDGTVWSWGYNGHGALGNGDVSNSSVPVQVVGLTSVTAIAAGELSGYALRSDGTVWAWGDNLYGRLGNSGPHSNVPVQVVGLTSVTQIAGGGRGGYALRSDGTVWAWGYNGDGELGNNSLVNSSVPVQVSGLSSVLAISGGVYAGYALLTGGIVLAWGYNGNGELGNNSTVTSSVPVLVSGLTSVTSIAGGGQSGYAVRSDGTLWSWGFNGEGELGNNSTTESHVPVPVGGLTSVTAIGAGYGNGYALVSDGTVWAWGRGEAGQLGSGSMPASSSLPVPVIGLVGVIGVGSGPNTSSGYAIEAR